MIVDCVCVYVVSILWCVVHLSLEMSEVSPTILLEKNDCKV